MTGYYYLISSHVSSSCFYIYMIDNRSIGIRIINRMFSSKRVMPRKRNPVHRSLSLFLILVSFIVKWQHFLIVRDILILREVLRKMRYEYVRSVGRSRSERLDIAIFHSRCLQGWAVTVQAESVYVGKYCGNMRTREGTVLVVRGETERELEAAEYVNVRKIGYERSRAEKNREQWEKLKITKKLHTVYM